MQTGHMPWLLKCGLDRLLFNDFIRGITPLKFLSKSIAEWRVIQGDSLPGRDLFAALLDAKDPQTGRGLDLKDLISEAALFIIGGSDTTITATTATIFYVLHYPNSLERRQHELRTKFKDAEDIRMGTDLASCTYLLACIDESMRLANPIGSLLPRETLLGGLKIDGEWFPPGIDVGVPNYTLHHNEEYFPDPFEFRPERRLPVDKRSQTRAESFTTSTSANEATIDTGLEVAVCIHAVRHWQNVLRRKVPGISRDVTYHCQGGLVIRYAYPTGIYSWRRSVRSRMG